MSYSIKENIQLAETKIQSVFFCDQLFFLFVTLKLYYTEGTIGRDSCTKQHLTRTINTLTLLQKKERKKKNNQTVDNVDLGLLIFYKIYKLGLYLCKKK